MLLSGKLARALSALGGRNLLKTGELLAGNLSELLPDSSVRSDGVKIVLSGGTHEMTLSPKEGKAVFRGKYYVYQKGSLVFQGDRKALGEVKALLAKLASERKNYLLLRYSEEQLGEYGIDSGFIAGLEKEVELLEVK